MEIAFQNNKFLVIRTDLFHKIRYNTKTNELIDKISGKIIQMNLDYSYICDVKDLRDIDYHKSISARTGLTANEILSLLNNNIDKCYMFDTMFLFFNKNGREYYDNQYIDCLWDKTNI